MDEKTRLEVALFRFSLIAPLVNGSLEGTVQDYVETVCAKTYDVPGVGQRQFSPRTLLVWRALYRTHGLEGLKMKRRSDRGSFRSLGSEAQEFLVQAVQHNPRRTATALYEELARARLLGQPPVSLSTVQRFLRTVEVPTDATPERRRFAFPHANDCWQSDLCAGPYLLEKGKKRKTHVIAILDDASRLVVAARVGLQSNYPAFEAVLKHAIASRGVPKRLYVDNAKIFHSQQLQLICARLGIIVSHSQPYEPQGRGKIERWFRTLREQCFHALTDEDLASENALSRALHAYVEGTYNIRPHRSLDGASPMQRYLADEEHLRQLSTQQLEQAFLHETYRRVGKDSTLSLEGTVFEVPPRFVDQRVHLRYSPHQPEQAWIEDEDGQLFAIHPVRPTDNAFIPRRRQEIIDYDALKNKEEG